MLSMTLLAMSCAGEPSLAGLTASAMSAGLAPRSPMASSGCATALWSSATRANSTVRARGCWKSIADAGPAGIGVTLVQDFVIGLKVC